MLSNKQLAVAGLTCLAVVLAALAASCHSASSPDNSSPDESTGLAGSQTAASTQSAMFISPAALDRFASLRTCQASQSLDGRNDTVSVLTDDSNALRVYLEYEIYDCAGNNNAVAIMHALVPEAASDSSVVTILVEPGGNLDIVQTDYSTVQKLIATNSIRRIGSAELLKSANTIYQLDDIPDIYYDFATFDDSLYGIPILVDASLIYIDSIAMSQFSIPPANDFSSFATFADLTGFCTAANGHTAAEAERQGITGNGGKPSLSAAGFKHPLALPLATPENRAKHFGAIMRSLASQQQNGQWAYGSWINPDGSAAFAGQAGIQALRILRDLAQACMGTAGLDYTDADLIEALQRREIAAAVLDASAAAQIYGQRNTELWNQYAQHLKRTASQAPQETANRDAFLESPISYSLMPRAGQPENPVASYTGIKFFSFPLKSDLPHDLSLKLVLEATDQDSQESVKYFGVPTRSSLTPTPIDPLNFEITSDASPTNYEITHRSAEMGLPPEVETIELTLAKLIVGKALANMLDPNFSPAETLAQAVRDYEAQR